MKFQPKLFIHQTRVDIEVQIDGFIYRDQAQQLIEQFRATGAKVFLNKTANLSWRPST